MQTHIMNQQKANDPAVKENTRGLIWDQILAMILARICWFQSEDHPWRLKPPLPIENTRSLTRLFRHPNMTLNNDFQFWVFPSCPYKFCFRGQTSRSIPKLEPTLPKTNSSGLKIVRAPKVAPENRPGPKRKFIFQPSIFRGEMLVLGWVRGFSEQLMAVPKNFVFQLRYLDPGYTKSDCLKLPSSSFWY